MSTLPRGVAALIAAAAALVPIPQWSQAVVQYTWTATTSGNWSNPLKWKDAVPPASAYDTFITFAGSGSTSYTATKDLPDWFTLQYLNVAAPGTVTITGQPLHFVATTNEFAYIVRYPSAGPGAGPTTTTATVANPISIDYGTLYINNNTQGPLAITGPITGPGSLLSGYQAGPVSFTAQSTFTGGAQFVANTVSVSGAGVVGAGPITIGAPSPVYDRGGRLTFDSAANVASDRSVTIRPGAFLEFKTLDNAAIKRIAADSNGVLALTPTTSVSPTLDLTGLPNVRIGTYDPADTANFTLSASITPANNTYRFGGQRASTSPPLNGSDSLTVSSHLTDAHPTAPRSVNIGSSRVGSGGYVRITNPANSYSGGTVIERGPDGFDFTALALDFTPAPGQTPLGTGPVTVYGNLVFDGYYAGSLGSLPNAFTFMPGSQLHFNNAAYVAPNTHASTNVNRWPDDKPIALNGTEIVRTAFSNPEVVGDLSFDNGSVITIDTSFGAGSAGPNGIQTPSLTRTNRGTLTVRTHSSTPIGATYVARVTGAAALKDPATGMIPPYVLSSYVPFTSTLSAEFLTADAAGNLTTTQYAASFNPASGNEILALGASTNLTTDETVYALKKTFGSLTIAAGKTLTIRSGGLIGSSTLSGGTVAFADNGAPVEALIFPDNSGTFTISSSITAAAGLTKFGPLPLRLSGANNIAGPVNVHDGSLVIASPASLNTAAVPVHVDYRGTLSFAGFNPTLSKLTGTGTLAAAITGATQTLTLNTAADSTFAGTLFGWNNTTLALTKTGAGSLTLSGHNRYNGLTTVSQGTLTLTGSNDIPRLPIDPLAIYRPDYTTAPGTHLQFLAPHHIDELSGTGSTTVGPSGSLRATRIQQSALIAAGPVSLPPDYTDLPSTLDTLTLLEGGSLELAMSTLIVSQTPPAVLRSYLFAGTLTSSDRPFYADAPLILGYSTTAGTTVVTLMLPGDADGSGDITLDDYALIDRGHATGGSYWWDGDFNYDGQVDQHDYLLADTHYALFHHPSPALLALRTAQFGPEYVAQLLTSIPEPSSLACLLATLPLLTRRSKRE